MGLLLILFVLTDNNIICMLGILSGSVLFSLCGVIVGTMVNNLNQYILGTVPFELVGFAPVIAYRAGLMWDNPLMLIHPGCAAMRLIEGKADMITQSLISLAVWISILYVIANKCVIRMYKGVGE